MHIAYVEDNLGNVALVERICQMTNDTLVTFGDADSALAEILPESADLILMDLHLGGRSMDGLQLTRLLRQKGISSPIVAITAFDSMGFADQYLEAGCNEYVVKPVSVNDMIRLLNEYRGQ
ncbi:MAG: response regulator [Anaerolineae bacterium]|nr:response regulator [Anaerolineae bacterium]NUQ02490.1 response regulator [Anaerolineae bacterium]